MELITLDKDKLGKAVFNLNKAENKRIGAEMVYV